MKKKLLNFLILFISFNLFSQEIILEYDKDKKVFNVIGDINKVRKGEKYTVKLININNAHISTVSKVTISEYISNIPEILKPIFTGISDNSMFGFVSTIGGNHKDSYIQALKAFKYLENIQNESNELYKKTNFNVKISEDSMRVLAKKTRDILLNGLNSIDEIVLEIEKKKSFIKSTRESYNKQIEDLTFEDCDYDLILSEYSDINLMNAKVQKTDYLGSLAFVKKSLKADTSLVVKKFTADKDIVDLDLKIYDNFKKDTIYNKTLSFKTYGNWSVDFSTGLFYSDLVENKYYLSPRNSSINNVLQDNVDNIDVSIGALGHITYKLSPSFGAGLALGASLSPFDGNLRYLIGPTLLFGNRKQGSITFGLSIANLDDLSDSVQRDDSGFFLDSSVTEIKIIKKVDTGFFFGLTYNLTRKKK